MSMHVVNEDEAAEDTLYWRVVDETIRVIFQGDGGIADDLRDTVLSRPWMERQAFYNTEPFDLAADLLEVEPTKEQYDRYRALSDRLIAEEEAASKDSNPGFPKPSSSPADGGLQPTYSNTILKNNNEYEYSIHAISQKDIQSSRKVPILDFQTSAFNFANATENLKGAFLKRAILKTYYGEAKHHTSPDVIQVVEEILGRKAGKPAHTVKRSKIEEY